MRDAHIYGTMLLRCGVGLALPFPFVCRAVAGRRTRCVRFAYGFTVLAVRVPPAHAMGGELGRQNPIWYFRS